MKQETIHQYRCIQITLVPEFCNAAQSCSQRGLATAWLTSECPRNFIPIPKSCTVMEAHCLSQCNDGSITRRLGQPIKQGILSTKVQFAPFLHEFTYWLKIKEMWKSNHGEIILRQQNRCTWAEICFSYTFPNTNPMWKVTNSKPGLIQNSEGSKYWYD